MAANVPLSHESLRRDCKTISTKHVDPDAPVRVGKRSSSLKIEFIPCCP